jgi:hypothetical protein
VIGWVGIRTRSAAALLLGAGLAALIALAFVAAYSGDLLALL